MRDHRWDEADTPTVGFRPAAPTDPAERTVRLGRSGAPNRAGAGGTGRPSTQPGGHDPALPPIVPVHPASPGPPQSGPVQSGPALSGPPLSGPALAGPALSGPEWPDSPRPLAVPAESEAELTVPIRLRPPAGLRVAVAVAVLLVTWSYLFALLPARSGAAPGLLVVVREWLNDPLGIGEDFGMLGLSMLLICAGYTVAAGCELRGPGRTMARTALLTVPIALLAVLLASGAVLLGGTALTVPAGSTSTGIGLGTEVIPAGPLFGEPVPFGLGWILTAGALFVLVAWPSALLPRRLGWLVPLVQLLVVVALVLTSSGVDGWYGELGRVAAFVPLATFGQAAHGPRSGRLPGWAAGLTGVAAVVVLVLAERVHPELNGWWYPLTALYAGLGTLLALTYGARVAGNAVVRWLASRALPWVLAVGVAGYPILDLLYVDAGLPLAPAFAAALPVTAVVAEGGYRLAALAGRAAR